MNTNGTVSLTGSFFSLVEKKIIVKIFKMLNEISDSKGRKVLIQDETGDREYVLKNVYNANI